MVFIKTEIFSSFQTGIGTIEFFAKQEVFESYRRIGVIRIDLVSNYETEALILQLI